MCFCYLGFVKAISTRVWEIVIIILILILILILLLVVTLLRRRGLENRVWKIDTGGPLGSRAPDRIRGVRRGAAARGNRSEKARDIYVYIDITKQTYYISLSLYIYIYMYLYMYIYIGIFVCISLSLSIYIYIYIYICI